MRKLRAVLLTIAALLAVWLVLAYAVLPFVWRHYEHQTKLDGLPMVTTTAIGLPGDAINVGLVGAQRDVLCAMRAAG